MVTGSFVLVSPGVTTSGQPPMSHLRLPTGPAVKANHVLNLVQQLCLGSIIETKNQRTCNYFLFVYLKSSGFLTWVAFPCKTV